MISLSILKPEQAAKYFEKDNYYSRETNHAQSEWLGKGAKALGLEGNIELKQFANVCYGKRPNGSEILVQGKQGRPIKRAGFDVCFSAPKTVTLMALVAGDERLTDAHKSAVRKAIEVAESRYAQARVGGQTDRQVVATRNLVVAAFDHNTSREKDPQLHTHCCVMNMTKRGDGKWRSVFCDPFWKNGKLLGTLYQNELAARVRELGYVVETKANGTFEIGGISKDIVRHFSRRSTKIEALDCQSKAEERVAKMKIRPPKGKCIPTEDLKRFWDQRLKTLGMSLPPPADAAILREGSVREREQAAWARSLLRGALDHLGERQVAFKREKVEVAALASQLGECSWDDLQFALRYLRTAKEILPAKDERLTTSKALDLEALAVGVVRSGMGSQEPLLRVEQVEGRIQELATLDCKTRERVLADLRELCQSDAPGILSALENLDNRLRSGGRLERQDVRDFRAQILDETGSHISGRDSKKLSSALTQALEPVEGLTRGQREALVKTLTSSDRVVAWQGVAGAGKSFALREIQELCAKDGHVVRGFAPSADAARVLETEAKIKSDTVASLLSKPVDSEKSQREIWIVDEAGLLGQRDCVNLLQRAEVCDARVVLVGDSRQLPSVEAGSAFRHLLGNGIQCVFLNESRRQKDESLENAATLMAGNHVTEALSCIEDRIVERKTSDARESLCAKSFLALKPAMRERTLVLAGTNRERESVISEIRVGLLSEGRLGNERGFSTLGKKDLTRVQRQMAYNYAEGDTLEIPGSQGSRWHKILSVDAISNTLTLLDTKGNFRMLAAADLGRSNAYTEREMKVAEGDKMRWTRNDREKSRTNGQEFEVQTIEADGVVVRYKTGVNEKVPLAEFKHVDYAWVQTKYAAQGKTCDRVLIVANENINRNALYVAMTRAKYDLKIFVDDREKFIGRAVRSGDKEIAHDVVEPESMLELSAKVSRDAKNVQHPEMDI